MITNVSYKFVAPLSG